MHNAEQVVNYIGRYSHRIAISNHRIKAIENDRVIFSAVDYRNSKTVMLNLDAVEFLHRFSLHILPPGFMKIRHYGILSSRNKVKALAYARKSLKANETNDKGPTGLSSLEWFSKLYGNSRVICPKCKSGTMSLVAVIYHSCRGSPLDNLRENMSFAS